MGGRVKIPLELCQILPGQPVQELSSDVLQDMIRSTAKKPQERFPKIQHVVESEYQTGGRAPPRPSEGFGFGIEDARGEATEGRAERRMKKRRGCGKG